MRGLRYDGVWNGLKSQRHRVIGVAVPAAQHDVRQYPKPKRWKENKKYARLFSASCTLRGDSLHHLKYRLSQFSVRRRANSSRPAEEAKQAFFSHHRVKANHQGLLARARAVSLSDKCSLVSQLEHVRLFSLSSLSPAFASGKSGHRNDVVRARQEPPGGGETAPRNSRGGVGGGPTHGGNVLDDEEPGNQLESVRGRPTSVGNTGMC